MTMQKIKSKTIKKTAWIGILFAAVIAPLAGNSTTYDCITCAGLNRPFDEDFAWMDDLKYAVKAYQVPPAEFTDWKTNQSPVLSAELTQKLWNMAPILPTEEQLAAQNYGQKKFESPLGCLAGWEGFCPTAENLGNTVLAASPLPVLSFRPVWEQEVAGYGIPHKILHQ